MRSQLAGNDFMMREYCRSLLSRWFRHNQGANFRLRDFATAVSARPEMHSVTSSRRKQTNPQHVDENDMAAGAGKKMLTATAAPSDGGFRSSGDAAALMMATGDDRARRDAFAAIPTSILGERDVNGSMSDHDFAAAATTTAAAAPKATASYDDNKRATTGAETRRDVSNSDEASYYSPMLSDNAASDNRIADSVAVSHGRPPSSGGSDEPTASWDRRREMPPTAADVIGGGKQQRRVDGRGAAVMTSSSLGAACSSIFRGGSDHHHHQDRRNETSTTRQDVSPASKTEAYVGPGYNRCENDVIASDDDVKDQRQRVTSFYGDSDVPPMGDRARWTSGDVGGENDSDVSRNGVRRKSGASIPEEEVSASGHKSKELSDEEESASHELEEIRDQVRVLRQHQIYQVQMLNFLHFQLSILASNSQPHYPTTATPLPTTTNPSQTHANLQPFHYKQAANDYASATPSSSADRSFAHTLFTSSRHEAATESERYQSKGGGFDDFRTYSRDTLQQRADHKDQPNSDGAPSSRDDVTDNVAAQKHVVPSDDDSLDYEANRHRNGVARDIEKERPRSTESARVAISNGHPADFGPDTSGGRGNVTADGIPQPVTASMSMQTQLQQYGKDFLPSTVNNDAKLDFDSRITRGEDDDALPSEKSPSLNQNPLRGDDRFEPGFSTAPSTPIAGAAAYQHYDKNQFRYGDEECGGAGGAEHRGGVGESETSKLQELVEQIDKRKALEKNECHICHRVLSCQSALKLHYRTHTGERPYKCDICARAFTTRGNLRTHYSSVHRQQMRASPGIGAAASRGPAPPVPGLQCPLCGSRFLDQQSMQQHMHMHVYMSNQQHRQQVAQLMQSYASAGPTANQPHPVVDPRIAMFAANPYHPYARPLPLPATAANSQAMIEISPPETVSRGDDDDEDDDRPPVIVDEVFEKSPAAARRASSSEASATPPAVAAPSEAQRDDGAPVERETAKTPPKESWTGRPSMSPDAYEAAPYALDLTRPSAAPHSTSTYDYVTASPSSATNSLTALAQLASNTAILRQNGTGIASYPLEFTTAATMGGDDPRPRKMTTACDICNKPFTCQSALEIHLRSHTKERPYKCRICERGFTTKGNLKQHLLTHNITEVDDEMLEPVSPQPTHPGPPASTNHSSPNSPANVATTLHRTTSNTTHSIGEKRHLEANLQATEAKQQKTYPRHWCHICQKQFSSASSLQIHNRTHTGEKPFACSVCGRAFTTKGNLKVHMGTHVWGAGGSRRGRRISMDNPLISPWMQNTSGGASSASSQVMRMRMQPSANSVAPEPSLIYQHYAALASSLMGAKSDPQRFSGNHPILPLNGTTAAARLLMTSAAANGHVSPPTAGAPGSNVPNLLTSDLMKGADGNNLATASQWIWKAYQRTQEQVN